MQIHLPIQFGIERKGQSYASHLAGKAHIDQLPIALIGKEISSLENILDPRCCLFVERHVGTALLVVFALWSQGVFIWKKKLISHNGIATGNLVDARGTVANPLSCHKNR